MSDMTLRQDIIDELDFDPSIDSANIGVAVGNGVGSYSEKIAAEKAAHVLRGYAGSPRK
jgi:hypothetical protein